MIASLVPSQLACLRTGQVEGDVVLRRICAKDTQVEQGCIQIGEGVGDQGQDKLVEKKQREQSCYGDADAFESESQVVGAIRPGHGRERCIARQSMKPFPFMAIARGKWKCAWRRAAATEEGEDGRKAQSADVEEVVAVVG